PVLIASQADIEPDNIIPVILRVVLPGEIVIGVFKLHPAASALASNNIVFSVTPFYFNLPCSWVFLVFAALRDPEVFATITVAVFVDASAGVLAIFAFADRANFRAVLAALSLLILRLLKNRIEI
ncbi:hypothetical protein, partial [Escherichia coli]|uniref:hypothetical protein n=1 Tax=Escherichia coli TaxID=562 RepID=UPI001F1933D5